MGHSQADKQASHERILRAAAARMRERGLEGVGVAELMKEAGLTHGGFYRHFTNREDLVAQSLACALAEGEARLDAGTEAAAAPLTELATRYLSEAHRDNVPAGCAVAALAADVARGTPEVRRVFTRQIERNTDLVQRTIAAERGTPTGRAEALNTLSLLAGALILSRAVDDSALSREILDAAKSALSGTPTEAPTPPRRPTARARTRRA